MRQPEYSGQFKKDVKRAKKSRKDLEKLKRLLDGHVLSAQRQAMGKDTEHSHRS